MFLLCFYLAAIDQRTRMGRSHKGSTWCTNFATKFGNEEFLLLLLGGGGRDIVGVIKAIKIFKVSISRMNLVQIQMRQSLTHSAI